MSRRNFAALQFVASKRTGALMLRMRGNRLTWLGHATFQVTTPSGKAVMFDPVAHRKSIVSRRAEKAQLASTSCCSPTAIPITSATPSRSASNSSPISSPCLKWARGSAAKGVGKAHGHEQRRHCKPSAKSKSPWFTPFIPAASRTTAKSFTPAKPQVSW